MFVTRCAGTHASSRDGTVAKPKIDVFVNGMDTHITLKITTEKGRGMAQPLSADEARRIAIMLVEQANLLEQKLKAMENLEA